MRVGLIQIQPLQIESDRCPPLGLLCLASHIKQYGYHPIIINLDPIYKNQKFPSDYFIQAARKILRSHAQVLGFSALCNTLPASLLIAKECKKLAPYLPIIFGGPDASFEDVELLRNFKQIDIIVRGEGEITLTELLGAIKKKKDLSKVLGITFRNDNGILRNTDRPFIKKLDSLVCPDFSLLPYIEKYEVGYVEAGRGCPFRCTFCSTCKMWKRNFRMKSPRRLAQELLKISHLFKKYGKFSIAIVHDNFLTSRKQIEVFLSLISKKNLSWTCDSRLDELDEDLIKKLSKAGCQEIFMGIESASPKIQKEIKKNLPISRLPKALEMLHSNDIKPNLSFIIGLPNETKAQINQTLLTALRSKIIAPTAHVGIHFFSILKGSELYEKVKTKLKLANLQPNDISPLVTSLPSEFSLIKKHPHIFPSFYSVKYHKSLDATMLYNICIIFYFLNEFFPMTTILLHKLLSVSPLQLGQKIIFFLDKSGSKLLQIFDLSKSFLHYFPHYNNFVIKNSDVLIKEVFTHEQRLLYNKYKKTETFISFHELTLSSHPKIARNVHFGVYTYNIFKLLKKLKTNRGGMISKSKCYVAYIPRTIDPLQLSSLSYNLLSFCNGKRTIQNIIQEIKARERTIKQSSTKLLEEFKTLQKQNIIYDKNAEGKWVNIVPRI